MNKKTSQLNLNSISAFNKVYPFKYWKEYLVGVIFLIITNLITLEVPKFAKAIINQVEAGSIQKDKTLNLASMIVFMGLLLFFIRTLSRVILFWPARKIETNVKDDLFQKFMKLPLKFFQKHSMGELISRMSNDVGHLRALYGFGLLQLLNLSSILVLAIFNMFSTHVSLTLAVLCPLVGLVFLAKKIMPKLHLYSKQNQVAVGDLTKITTEVFVNIPVIQTSNTYPNFLNKMDQKNKTVYNTNLKMVVIRNFMWPLLLSLHNISTLIVMIFGGYLAINNQITLGDIIAFNIYVGLLAFPLMALGIFISLVQGAKSALERINDIHLAENESLENKSSVQWDSKNKFESLKIKNLNHYYGDKKVLSNISFTATKNSFTGIYGPVGSGKTTLFDIISHLIPPEANQVFYNDADISDIDPVAIRKKIGYVQQTSQLFNMSIIENLNLGLNPAKDTQDVNNELANVGLLDEVLGFNEGINSLIGEKGLRLSGGQRQRLCLARMLLHEKSILLLDDVLSAVDQQTERTLIKLLKSIDVTIILSSHRTEVLKQCDQIIILDTEGKQLDVGNYDKLLEHYPSIEANHD